MNVFEIKNARKSFDGEPVLKDISVSVEQGEVVAVLGPSGSGKSTLLRCATMLERLDGGAISYSGEYAAEIGENGNAVYAPSKKLRSLRSRFGLVFQNFNLFPHYSVMKNIIDAPINVLGKSKAEAEKTARELLQKMGLKGKEDAYPCQLSGGQQQRVSIARALAMNPSILFFDEPTSALDPELTGEILNVIKELAAEKMTMVIVTHEISFAHDVADRVIFMADGVIVEEGAPADIIDNPSNPRTRSFLSRINNN